MPNYLKVNKTVRIPLKNVGSIVSEWRQYVKGQETNLLYYSKISFFSRQKIDTAPTLIASIESNPEWRKPKEVFLRQSLVFEETIEENEMIIGIGYGRLNQSKFQHVDRF